MARPQAAPMLRRTSSGRDMPLNYFEHAPGSEDDAAIRPHLLAIRNFAYRFGFESLFDVVLAEARLSPVDAHTFAEQGGLSRLYQYCCATGRNQPSATLRKELCEFSRNVYREEWNTLLRDKTFKVKLESFKHENVQSFSFSDLYARMEHNAPNLVGLTATLISSRPLKENKEDSDEERNKRLRKKQRRIVVALSILGNETSQQFNILQNIIAFLLFSSKVPKRIIAILNHLGLSTSYTGLQTAINSGADALKERLRNICSHGEAIWVSFDNLTCAANVRDQRLFNQGDFLTYTAGYVVRPHPSIAHPMFTHADRRYDRVTELNVLDFIPSADDRKHLSAAFESMIYTVVKGFLAYEGIKLPKSNFSMPKIFQLDPQHRPEIITLPTYDLNEGVIAELIKILEKIQLDIGLSPDQVKQNVLLYKGDFMTVRQNRSFLSISARLT